MRISSQDVVRALKALKTVLVWVAHALKVTWKWLRRVFKTMLRFLNLLEPDVPYMVLSLSKISVWFTLGLMVYVVVTGKGMTEIGGALLGNIGSIANYAYRRRLQVHTRTGAYGNYVDPDYDETEPYPQSDIGQPFPGPMVQNPIPEPGPPSVLPEPDITEEPK